MNARNWMILIALLAASAPGVVFAQGPDAPVDEALPEPGELEAPEAEPVAETGAEPAAEPAGVAKPDEALPPFESKRRADVGVGAQVEIEEPQGSRARELSFVLAPHVGVLVPQIFSDLGSWPVFGVEFGYILPFDVGPMIRPLQLALDVMYTQPEASGSGFDADLGDEGADWEWELVQQTLIVELAGLWRFLPPGEGFSAYGTIGPRLYLMQSEMTASGNDGSSFGENTETKTEVGLMVGGGAEYAFGPGSVFAGLEMGWSDLNTRITGDSNTGALVLDLGYRFMF